MMYTTHIYNEQTLAYIIAKIAYNSPLNSLLSNDRRLQSTRIDQYTHRSNNNTGYCNGNYEILQQDYWILQSGFSIFIF